MLHRPDRAPGDTTSPATVPWVSYAPMAFLLVAILTAGGGPAGSVAAAPPDQPTGEPALVGRVVAVGIPGVGAISAVGTFHPGGPIRDRREFAMFAAPGQVLDPARILVASSSAFGAPPARTDMPSGAILSVDPNGEETLVVRRHSPWEAIRPLPLEGASVSTQVRARRS
jgi:hypothetical protein